MSINSAAVLHFLFECTQFSLTALLLYYLFSEKVLPYLYGQMQEEAAHWDELSNKKDLLVDTRAKIEDKMRREEATLAEIENKVERWHHSTRLQEAALAREVQETQVALQLKHMQQQKYFHFQKLRDEVIPRSLQAASIELQKMHEEASGRAIFGELIGELERKTQRSKTRS